MSAASGELDRLIADQARDDTYRVHSVSLDTPAGQVALHGTRWLTASDPRHGTLYAAKGLGCKCDRCRAASAAYQREYNRRRGTKTRFVCACCGSTDIRKERVR